VNFQNPHRPLPKVHLNEYAQEHQEYLQGFKYEARKRFAASMLKMDEGTLRQFVMTCCMILLMKRWAAVKRIVDALEDSGLHDNTYIVYISDNGACYEAGGLNLPHRGTKKHLFEGPLRPTAPLCPHPRVPDPTPRCPTPQAVCGPRPSSAGRSFQPTWRAHTSRGSST
jgi:hypothetical protein